MAPRDRDGWSAVPDTRLGPLSPSMIVLSTTGKRRDYSGIHSDEWPAEIDS